MMKHRLLAFTAIVALCNAGAAIAFDARTQGTGSADVEVNNSALDKLAQSPQPVAAGGTTPVSPTAQDFLTEQPVKYPVVKPVHKKKKHKAKPKNPVQTPVAPTSKVDTAPEVKVVGNSGAVPTNSESIPELVTLPGHAPATTTTTPPAVTAPITAPAQVPPPAMNDVPVPAPTPTPATKPAADMAPVTKSTAELPPLPAPGNSVLPPLPEAAPTAPTVPGAPETNAMPPLPATGAATELQPLPPAASNATMPLPGDMTQKGAPATAAATTASDQVDAAEGKPDLRIVFNEAETEVPLSETVRLDALVQQINQFPSARVSIVAYASGSDASAGVDLSKRVSLKRGIAVRNYVVGKNIDVERITVKAQGNKTTSGPANRVDLFILK